MPLILCQPRAPGRKVYDLLVAFLVSQAFVGFVRAVERMPRMSSVVKSEGDYEFQMAGSQEPNQRLHSHRAVRAGCSPPASGAHWRRDLKKILVRPAPCDLATSPTAAV